MYLVLKSSDSKNPCNAWFIQPTFGEEMFLPNQRSKPTFRKNAEHYVAYNALYVIYLDTISCMYQHIQAEMHLYYYTRRMQMSTSVFKI